MSQQQLRVTHMSSYHLSKRKYEESSSEKIIGHHVKIVTLSEIYTTLKIAHVWVGMNSDHRACSTIGGWGVDGWVENNLTTYLNCFQ